MKKIVLTHALVAGAVVFLMMLLTRPLMADPKNYSLTEILGWISILLSLSAVFIAIKIYRDKYNEGKISFGKAFRIGLYITLIAGTIYSLSFIIYYHLDPAMSEFMRNYFISGVEKLNLPPAEKAAKLAEMQKQMEFFSNPIVMFLFGLVMEYGWPGVLVSLIAAAILKKK